MSIAPTERYPAHPFSRIGLAAHNELVTAHQQTTKEISRGLSSLFTLGRYKTRKKLLFSHEVAKDIEKLPLIAIIKYSVARLQQR